MAARSFRVALVRLDDLGDHVLGSGVVHALRAYDRKAQLVAIVPATLRELYAHCTDLNATLLLPAAKYYLHSEATFTDLRRRLRSVPKFDLVINPRFAEDWYAAGAICAAIGKPGGRVLGFRQSHSPIPGFDPNGFYTQLLDAPVDLHTACYAELIAAAATHASVDAPPTVWFSPEDWRRVWQSFGLQPREYVVVGLGASCPYKCPSVEVYERIVQQLCTLSQRIILTGTEADRDLAGRLLESAGSLDRPDSPEGPACVLSACGRLRLYELAALLAHAALYIGPDAGPKHMAAASGTPVLEISWVPADYPVSSRGPASAGACWSPWQTLSRSVHPQAAVFAGAQSHPQFFAQPIAGIDPGEIERGIEELLGIRAPSACRAGCTRPPPLVTSRQRPWGCGRVAPPPRVPARIPKC